MKKIVFLSIAGLLALISAAAQQTGKVTAEYFPDPDVEFDTPAFSRRHGFTSYDQMNAWLDELAKRNPELVTLSSVGRTQRGREIVMVRIGRGGENRLRVLYTGCVHGNEPGGTEGLLYFAAQLTRDERIGRLVDSIDFYIIPMVNADGSERNTRATANGIDLNRDQTILSTPEARAMHRAASEVRPHLFVDFHEYKPLRSSYSEVADGRIVTNPHDVMFLWSSNPNVAPSLRAIVDGLFIPEAENTADSEGLTHHIYYTTKSDRGQTVFNVGGSSPRSSSNIMALRGAVSMLMEVRGIGIGRTSYKRRVNTVYRLAESFAATAADNASALRNAVAEAETWNGDIAVSFRSRSVGDYPVPFIDMIACDTLTVRVPARVAPETEIVASRPRPSAYWLDASERRAAETLALYGVRLEHIDAPRTIMAERYRVTSSHESHDMVAGILPLTVKTELVRERIELPAGSYRIPLDQPLATLAAVLLEPESANGFVNYRVADPAGIYREIEPDSNDKQ